MYSGLLPSGLTYSDSELDSDDDNSSVLIDESAKTDYRKDEKTDLLLESPSTSNVINYNDSNECLPGVSLEMWQRFKQLQKQNLEMKNMKRPKERRRRKKKHKKVEETSSSTEPVKEREVQAVREEHWNGLKQYFDINDRFQPPACSRPLPKTGLEKNIDHAIAEGDFEKAEELSDTLAVRELAVKIAKATDCRDFVKTKQEAEASREAQKRKKQVAWGFEAKKRWETKSNMGYM